MGPGSARNDCGWRTAGRLQAKADAAEKARAAAEAKAADDAKNKEQKPAQVAALPADAAAANPSAPAPGTKPSAQDIARTLQTELRRVSCFTGNIDGEWKAASQHSLDLFDKSAGMKLDVKMASADALDAVKAKPGRVCP